VSFGTRRIPVRKSMLTILCATTTRHSTSWLLSYVPSIKIHATVIKGTRTTQQVRENKIPSPEAAFPMIDITPLLSPKRCHLAYCPEIFGAHKAVIALSSVELECERADNLQFVLARSSCLQRTSQAVIRAKEKRKGNWKTLIYLRASEGFADLVEPRGSRTSRTNPPSPIQQCFRVMDGKYIIRRPFVVDTAKILAQSEFHV